MLLRPHQSIDVPVHVDPRLSDETGSDVDADYLILTEAGQPLLTEAGGYLLLESAP